MLKLLRIRWKIPMSKEKTMWLKRCCSLEMVCFHHMDSLLLLVSQQVVRSDSHHLDLTEDVRLCVRHEIQPERSVQYVWLHNPLTNKTNMFPAFLPYILLFLPPVSYGNKRCSHGSYCSGQLDQLNQCLALSNSICEIKNISILLHSWICSRASSEKLDLWS